MKSLNEKHRMRRQEFRTLDDVGNAGQRYTREMVKELENEMDDITFFFNMRAYFVYHYEGYRFCDYDRLEEFSFEEAFTEFFHQALFRWHQYKHNNIDEQEEVTFKPTFRFN